MNFTAGLLFLLLACAIFAFVLKIKDRMIAPFELSLATALQLVLYMILSFILIIPIENVFSKKRFFAKEINAAVPPGRTLFILDVGYQPYLYYVRNPKQNIYSYESIGENVGLIMMPERTYNDMLDSLKKNPRIFAGKIPREIRTVKYKRINYQILELKSN